MQAGHEDSGMEREARYTGCSDARPAFQRSRRQQPIPDSRDVLPVSRGHRHLTCPPELALDLPPGLDQPAYGKARPPRAGDFADFVAAYSEDPNGATAR